MFTRILVPLDGSDRAEQAIPVAARIARAANGTVILVQVTTFPSNFFTEGKYPSQIYSEDLIEEGKALAANYLYNVSKKPELVDLKTETRVEYGDAAQSILAAVEPLEVDLIAMCSHGYTGFKRWALGSVARKIIPHSSVPVLVLRDGGSTLSVKPPYALVALDGSPVSEEVLGPVIQLMAALAPSEEKTLHLIHVVELPLTYGRIGIHAYVNQMKEEVKRQSQAYLAAVAERFTHGDVSGLTVTTSIAVNVDVAEALVQVAQQQLLAGGHFDLVAMATHGRSGLQRLLMGSMTDHVMSATKLPMLVVHPSGQSKQARANNEQVGATS
jgi:nucleotide-binding universal stress UspA family protein